MEKKIVVFGFYGSKQDDPEKENGPTFLLSTSKRKWRDKIERRTVDEYYLFYQKDHEKKVPLLQKQIRKKNPSIKFNLVQTEFKGPWELTGVFAYLLNFMKDYSFDSQNNDYYIHLTTGTDVIKIAWFLLVSGRYRFIKFIQSIPASGNSKYSNDVIDLNLDQYSEIQELFRTEQAKRVEKITQNDRYVKIVDEILNKADHMDNDDKILLMGETGVGKTRLIDQIYEKKFPKDAKKVHLVKLNCATLQKGMAMSILCGHKKGAFTGAVEDHTGKLQIANGGLLFLDEIGELELDVQAMLLKVIDEKIFYRFGGNEEMTSKFFLVCATNRDLKKETEEKRFRRDLLARIDTWVYEIPPLRKRPEDIKQVFEDQLNDYAFGMDSEAKDLYLNFACSDKAVWTGNFRDLIKSIHRMRVNSCGKMIRREIVREEIEYLLRQWQAETMPRSELTLQNDPNYEIVPETCRQNIDDIDLVQLLYVIKICGQSKNLADAYRQLHRFSRDKKMSSNDSDALRKYLKKFHLDFNTIQSRLKEKDS
ncbi:MAG: RNA repair transcriptional activator RtcR family protein [Planctomycetia bacterium]|nr:RNA repair transcriptional activator RtcR family protein [Planctomycetia bacterium]